MPCWRRVVCVIARLHDCQNVQTKGKSPNIDVDKKKLEVPQDGSKKAKLQLSNKNAGGVMLSAMNGDYFLCIVQQVYDRKQQFQQIAAYGAQLNPVYADYLFVFLVLLVRLCRHVANLQGEGLMLESYISSLRWELRIPAQQWQTRLKAR